MKDAESTSIGQTAASGGPHGLRLALASAIGAVVVCAIAFVLIFWDEVLLAAPIIFLVKVLGFWPAYAVFVAAWTAMNVASLTVFDRAWERIRPRLASAWRALKRGLGLRVEEQTEPEEKVEEAKSWRMRIVLWTANVFRPLGAFANGVFLGGPFGAPMYRALGYKGWTAYGWIIVMTPVYGLVWVSFYGQGGIAVLDLVGL